MRVVFDTNIYLASLLKRGLSFQVLEHVINPRTNYFLYTSDEILDELKEKAMELVKSKAVKSKSARRLLEKVKRQANTVKPTLKLDVISQDPDDNKVLECAVEARANLIISMDKHLLRLKVFRNIAIVHPRTFFYISSSFG